MRKEFWINIFFFKQPIPNSCSSWTVIILISQVKAYILQGSVLEPLLFLVYIKDLPESLNSNVKLFADDAWLFSFIHDPRVTTKTLNEDLSKVSRWAHQWKMLFNSDSSKQAQETAFSRKNRGSNHGSISFNNMIISKENVPKHLGLLLDVRLNLVEHINAQIKNVFANRSILKHFFHNAVKNW